MAETDAQPPQVPQEPAEGAPPAEAAPPPAEGEPAPAPPAEEAPPSEPAPPAEAPPAEAAPPAEPAPPAAEAPPAEPAPPAEAAPPAEPAPAAETPAEPAPPAEAAPPAEPAPAAGVELQATVEETWEADGATVQKYKVIVTNKTDAAVADIELEIANIAAFDDSWNSTVVRVGDGKPALLGLPDYLLQAGGLAPGASHELGFVVKKGEGEPAITVKAK